MQFSLAALLAVAFSATSVYAACPDGAGNYPVRDEPMVLISLTLTNDSIVLRGPQPSKIEAEVF